MLNDYKQFGSFMATVDGKHSPSQMSLLTQRLSEMLDTMSMHMATSQT